jgi:hypothetical protein
LPARWSILLTFAKVGRLELQVAAMKQFRQAVRQQACQEQCPQDAVERSRARQITPSPTEKSHGFDTDYPDHRTSVRWRRILGPQARSLVMNRLFRVERELF